MYIYPRFNLATYSQALVDCIWDRMQYFDVSNGIIVVLEGENLLTIALLLVTILPVFRLALDRAVHDLETSRTGLEVRL